MTHFGLFGSSNWCPLGSKIYIHIYVFINNKIILVNTVDQIMSRPWNHIEFAQS